MGERLKELRINKGLTLKDVAAKIGVSLQAISNYEQEIREPSIEKLKALCRFYEVSSDYIIGLTDY